MKLENLLHTLTKKELWFRWFAYWTATAVIITIFYTLTKSLSAGLFAGPIFLAMFLGLLLPINLNTQSTIISLTSISVSVAIFLLLKFVYSPENFSSLAFVKAWAESFLYALILGLALWIVGFALMGLNFLLSLYLKLENKIMKSKK